MFNRFISSVSRIFGGRRPKPPTGCALTPVLDATPPMSVGEEEIASSRWSRRIPNRIGQYFAGR